MKLSSACTLLLSSAVLLTALPAEAVKWTNQGYSTGIEGFNPKETTISASNVQNLSLAWQSSTTDINGPYAMVEDKGTIFVLSQDQNGTADVVALNGSTGAELWKASLNAGVATFGGSNRMGIAAGSGMVFSACVTTNVPEGLCAFSQKTGTLVWSDNYYVQGFADGGAFERPTFDRGVVYVSENMCDSDQPTCDDFSAVNAKTGTIIWGAHASATGYDGPLNDWSPAVLGGVMYVPCEYIFNGNNDDDFTGVCTFSTSNGTAGWQFGVVNETPIFGLSGAVSVSGRTVFFQQNTQNNSQSVLTALNASTGVALWTFSSVYGSNDVVQPTVAQGAVYWPDNGGTLWALKEKTGATIWSTNNWGSFCSPVAGYESQSQVANGVVFITTGCQNGGTRYVTTFAVAASSGNVLWQDAEGFNTTPIVTSGAAPMIINGGLYSDCVQVCSYRLPGGSARYPMSGVTGMHQARGKSAPATR